MRPPTRPTWTACTKTESEIMRYLPLTDEDRRAMLAKIGVPSVGSLYRDVPAGALLKDPVDLPRHAGELEVERAIGAMAAKNLGTGSGPSFLGARAHSAPRP